MNQSIIIIESPNKVQKIQSITGSKTFATIGHFKTLTQDNYINYETYEPCFDFKDEKRKKEMNYIFSQCKDKEVIIATDPDREGYAIGFFCYLTLKNIAKNIKRAEFHEITEAGIKKGLEKAIDFSKTNFDEFESFKARAVGDKLVGFILSPKYIQEMNDKNVSIGRVQTPALNLIVTREKEIQDFNKEDANKKLDYKLKTKLKKEDLIFELKSDKIFKEKAEVDEILKDLKESSKKAIFVKKTSKESKISPPAPFRTSQLQEKANKAFKFKTDETMKHAQELFEKGLITYIRTDSNSLSAEFLEEMKKHYEKEQWYQRREYKAGKQSQAEAHEAIRITHAHAFEEIEKIANENKLSKDTTKLYTLIYINSICSQAKDCINQIDTYEFNINGLIFKINTTKTLYEGFKDIFKENKDEIEDENTEEQAQNIDLSKLVENENLEIVSVESQEIKKQAPKRYKESNFISLLEKEGIGRPSTYASFLPTLLKRNYIEVESKKGEIKPTEKGLKLIEILLQKDNWIAQSEYTKIMEQVLEDISQKKSTYKEFIQALHEKMEFKKMEREFKGASEKQIEFLKKLAKDQNIEIKEEDYKDAQACSAKIEELKKKQAPRPPSEKQIKLAMDLAQKNNLELPKDYDKNMKICSDFIDKVFKKAKK